MPVNSHLKWTELRDFAPGLFTKGDWLIPLNGAQQMDDCYPQPGGGLRAWYKASSVSTSGIASATKERPLGLALRGGIAARSGAPTNLEDRYLCTYFYDSGASANSKARPRLYRMDGTNSETTWTRINKTGAAEFAFATSDNNAPAKTSFVPYRLADGTDYMAMVLRYVGGGDDTLWKLKYSDLSSAMLAEKIATDVQRVGPIAVHQERLVIAQGGATVPERLWWTDVGTFTFSAANYLDVLPNQYLPGISLLSATPPSDLLVGKHGSPWALVQGTISNPTVRQMGVGHGTMAPIQDAGNTPYGVTFIEPNSGIWLTDGRNFTALSASQLDASTFSSGQGSTVSTGDTVFMNDFLFCPLGYVFDFSTKSWFKQTDMAGSFKAIDPYVRTVMGSTADSTSFGLRDLVPYDDSSRVRTYTWKSAPLRAPDGRQIEIREVQVYLKSYGSGASCAVTVNGTTVTVSSIGSGKQMVSFLFRELAEVLDVKVVPNSGSDSVEAPSLECVRIGVGRGHLSY